MPRPLEPLVDAFTLGSHPLSPALVDQITDGVRTEVRDEIRSWFLDAPAGGGLGFGWVHFTEFFQGHPGCLGGWKSLAVWVMAGDGACGWDQHSLPCDGITGPFSDEVLFALGAGAPPPAMVTVGIVAADVDAHFQGKTGESFLEPITRLLEIWTGVARGDPWPMGGAGPWDGATCAFTPLWNGEVRVRCLADAIKVALAIPGFVLAGATVADVVKKLDNFLDGKYGATRPILENFLHGLTGRDPEASWPAAATFTPADWESARQAIRSLVDAVAAALAMPGFVPAHATVANVAGKLHTFLGGRYGATLSILTRFLKFLTGLAPGAPWPPARVFGPADWRRARQAIPSVADAVAAALAIPNFVPAGVTVTGLAMHLATFLAAVAGATRMRLEVFLGRLTGLAPGAPWPPARVFGPNDWRGARQAIPSVADVVTLSMSNFVPAGGTVADVAGQLKTFLAGGGTRPILEALLEGLTGLAPGALWPAAHVFGPADWRRARQAIGPLAEAVMAALSMPGFVPAGVTVAGVARRLDMFLAGEDTALILIDVLVGVTDLTPGADWPPAGAFDLADWERARQAILGSLPRQLTAPSTATLADLVRAIQATGRGQDAAATLRSTRAIVDWAHGQQRYVAGPISAISLRMGLARIWARHFRGYFKSGHKHLIWDWTPRNLYLLQALIPCHDGVHSVACQGISTPFKQTILAALAGLAPAGTVGDVAEQVDAVLKANAKESFLEIVTRYLEETTGVARAALWPAAAAAPDAGAHCAITPLWIAEAWVRSLADAIKAALEKPSFVTAGATIKDVAKQLDGILSNRYGTTVSILEDFLRSVTGLAPDNEWPLTPAFGPDDWEGARQKIIGALPPLGIPVLFDEQIQPLQDALTIVIQAANAAATAASQVHTWQTLALHGSPKIAIASALDHLWSNLTREQLGLGAALGTLEALRAEWVVIMHG